MHTIRPNPSNPEEWQVIFIGYANIETTIASYPNQDIAMSYCSFLNGGMHPLGYHMEVTCHH